jgi:hypothetical protein
LFDRIQHTLQLLLEVIRAFCSLVPAFCSPTSPMASSLAGLSIFDRMKRSQSCQGKGTPSVVASKSSAGKSGRVKGPTSILSDVADLKSLGRDSDILRDPAQFEQMYKESLTKAGANLKCSGSIGRRKLLAFMGSIASTQMLRSKELQNWQNELAKIKEKYSKMPLVEIAGGSRVPSIALTRLLSVHGLFSKSFKLWSRTWTQGSNKRCLRKTLLFSRSLSWPQTFP